MVLIIRGWGLGVVVGSGGWGWGSSFSIIGFMAVLDLFNFDLLPIITFFLELGGLVTEAPRLSVTT